MDRWNPIYSQAQFLSLMPSATFMPLASELPSGALVKAWTTHHPGQAIGTEQEACGFHLCLLTYANLNLCNGNNTALVLSNWLPGIIFVLGSRMQLSLKREKSNKSDSCLFYGSGDSESLFQWLEFFTGDIILLRGMKSFLWPRRMGGNRGCEDHFLPLLSSVQVQATGQQPTLMHRVGTAVFTVSLTCFPT